MSKPDNKRRPAPLDYRGTVLITGAMGLIVLGLQQSAVWGWSSVATWACVVVGALLMIAFVLWEMRTPTRCCGCGSSATAGSRPRPPCSG